MSTLHGTIVAAFGRTYLAELADGEMLECTPRGKKSEAACGDLVELRRTAHGQAAIEAILPRRTLFYRSVAHREKLIAANATQLIVVVATEPSFSDELLTRSLVAAHQQGLEVMIVLNKCDLPKQAALQQLQPYRDAGYRVLELSARHDASPLRRLLEGQRSMLVGQSGMGKSTLINALVPHAQAATREISSALNSGKHTTTHARLYRLDADSSLIDCPGIQAFGLHHLTFGDIEEGFPEFAQYRGQCRFRNCRHRDEPGCAICAAAEHGEINPRRLQIFQTISQR